MAKTRVRVKAGSRAARKPLLSDREFAQLGTDEVGYILEMSPREARRLHPTIRGLPRYGTVYALQRADGTTIALTDSHAAIVVHAADDDLSIVSLH